MIEKERHHEINATFQGGGPAWIIDGSPSGEWMLAWNPELGEADGLPGSDQLHFGDGQRWRQPLLSEIHEAAGVVHFKAVNWHDDGGECTMVPLTIAEAKKRGGELGKLVETFDPENEEHQAYFLMEFRPA